MEDYLYLEGVHPSKKVTVTFTPARSRTKQHEGKPQIYTISSSVDQNLILGGLSCTKLCSETLYRVGWDRVVHEHAWSKKILASGHSREL